MAIQSFVRQFPRSFDFRAQRNERGEEKAVGP